MNADDAYAQCEQITWEQARNFAYGIRLLPPDKRRALAAVYAFARRIDDIGDGDLPAAEKTAQLEAARGQVHALVAAAKDVARNGAGPQDLAQLDDTDPVLVALTDTGQHFAVPLAAFTELIDGCLADVNQATYKTFDDLLWYCRCVAGSIGRLSLGIYGTGHQSGQPEKQNKLADDLGVALQLTNILRDVREDFRNNRVYLPKEDLDKFGIEFAPFGEPEPFPGDGDAGAVREPGRVRGQPGPRVVRQRPAAARHDRPAQRGLHGRDGRHLPPPARAHRGQPARRARGPHVPARQREGPGRRPGAGRLRPVEVPQGRRGHRSAAVRAVVIGGGLAGITAAVALGKAGHEVTLLEAKPRLGGATMSFTGTAWSSTPASTSSCAAAPPTAACSTASA